MADLNQELPLSPLHTLEKRLQPKRRGKPGRPFALIVPGVEELNLREQAHEKQAELLRHDAYQFARLLGRDIRIKLRGKQEKGLRDLFWSWGVAADKVIGGAEANVLSLHVPAILLDKLLIGVNMKRESAQVVDNTENTSLHNRTLSDLGASEPPQRQAKDVPGHGG